MIFKLIYVMCFYDSISSEDYLKKREVTIKMLLYLKHLQQIFKDKFEFKFLLCGSEKEDSRNLVQKYGFLDHEYVEFDQTPYKNKLIKIIESKYNFAYETALKLYPDYDLFITGGSSDFVPIQYYENLYNYYIDNQNSNFIGILNSFENGGIVINYDYSNKTPYILNNKLLIEKKENKENKENNHIYFIIQQPIGGICCFSKKLIDLMNSKIILDNGDEYKLFRDCKEKYNTKQIFLENYFINIKNNKSDTNTLQSFIALYNLKQFNRSYRREQYYNKVNDFIKLILSFDNYNTPYKKTLKTVNTQNKAGLLNWTNLLENFDTKRIFFVSDFENLNENNKIRGKHINKDCNEILVVLSGSITVKLVYNNKEYIYECNKNDYVYIPQEHYVEIEIKDKNTVYFVLCDTNL